MNKYWWNDYVGLPYKDMGRDGSGVDCAGLVCLVYRELKGINLDQEFGFYDPMNRAQAAELIQKVSAGWHQVEHPQDFDVAKLLIVKCEEPSHLGIVVNGGKSLLNVREKIGTVIEPIRGGIWEGRIHSYWRQNG